jgi:uncharacterized protein (DUF885 family)
MVSCTSAPDADSEFEALVDVYFEQLLEMNPQWATYLGDHRYDHLMDDYSLEGYKKDMAFAAAFLDSLKTIDRDGLGFQNRIDYDILTHRLKSSIFRLDTLRSYEWNPRNYNVGGAIYSLLARDFAPLEERLRSLKGRLEAIPGVLDQARINLQNPPEIYTETAIRQNKGTISLIRDELSTFVDKVPEMKDEIKPLQDQAVTALEEYGKWLENDLLPRSNGDFRLGDEKYRAKLKYTLYSDRSPEQILEVAGVDLAATQAAMFETAIPLYREYFPDRPMAATHQDSMRIVKKVLDRMADDHPTEENIVDVINASLKECDDFVRSMDMVSHPGTPIKVIVMPEFQRGVAIGYCDSPGPLEKEAETFYAIAPPPEYWDDDRVESYFREYNNYMLHDLTIHEAMPGHYLQIAHANNVEAPTIVRKIYGSGTFVEGWATYAEQLMVEHGYGGPEIKMQQLKMRLRLIINAIIDQKIHTAGMTEEEAMEVMMAEGLQEEGEAAGKWRRACLTSTQLSTYYVGNIEVNEIREAYLAKHGADADLKVFHDKLLSFGSPPPAYVKELMGL